MLNSHRIILNSHEVVSNSIHRKFRNPILFPFWPKSDIVIKRKRTEKIRSGRLNPFVNPRPYTGVGNSHVKLNLRCRSTFFIYLRCPGNQEFNFSGFQISSGESDLLMFMGDFGCSVIWVRRYYFLTSEGTRCLLL